MFTPKRILRGLPALGRLLDARLAGHAVPGAAGSYPRPGLPGGPRLPLGLPPGIGAAMPSTLRGGSTPGGGGLPGGEAPGTPGAPAYPENSGPPDAGWLFQSFASSASVANSTAETGLALTGRGSPTLPAGYFAAGRGLELELAGSSAADPLSSGNFATLRVYLGAVQQFSATFSASLFSHFGTWTARLRLVCDSPGASGAFHGSGELWPTVAYTMPPLSYGCSTYRWECAGASLDTTGALAVAVTGQHSEALADNSLTLSGLALRRVF